MPLGLAPSPCCIRRLCSDLRSRPCRNRVIYAGFSDCGEYLHDLRQTGAPIVLKEATVSEAYDQFCQDHPAAWNLTPTQDTEDLVEHLLMLIKRTIEVKLSKPTDREAALTRKEIWRFRELCKVKK